MGSGIALLLWTAKLPSPFLFLYHRYVSILKYNTAGVCLAIKKAMPVNGHRLFDHERTRCNGDHGKIDGFTAMLDNGTSVSSAFPSKGRCPEGADRAPAAGKRAGRSVSSTSFMRVPERRSASIYIKSEARSRIILAPSTGRGRRAKRGGVGGVGILASENTASRSQPPPLRGTSFQRKEGEKRSALTGN